MTESHGSRRVAFTMRNAAELSLTEKIGSFLSGVQWKLEGNLGNGNPPNQQLEFEEPADTIRR